MESLQKNLKASEKIWYGDLIFVNEHNEWVLGRTLKYTLASPELKDAFVALHTVDKGDYCLAVTLKMGNDIIFNVQLPS